MMFDKKNMMFVIFRVRGGYGGGLTDRQNSWCSLALGLFLPKMSPILMRAGEATTWPVSR